MCKSLRIFGFILIPLIIAGCIKVELKDEREIPRFFEIALVTYTPGSSEAALATTTTTSLPTNTPTPKPTDTPLPSQTPVTFTPALSAMVTRDTACRQGPGDSFPGSSYLTTGETVALVGRNPDVTWWLVQKEDSAQICWASNDVLTLSGDTLSVAIMSALPTPTRVYYAQPIVSPTLKPRPKPPRTTSVAPPSATDTPAPYPYPAP